MERVMFTVPADLLQEVDALAHRTKQKRSHLVRQALQELLQRHRQQEFEALMAEGYQEMADEAAALAGESVSLQAVATDGVWRWDEPTTSKA